MPKVISPKYVVIIKMYYSEGFKQVSCLAMLYLYASISIRNYRLPETCPSLPLGWSKCASFCFYSAERASRNLTMSLRDEASSTCTMPCQMFGWGRREKSSRERGCKPETWSFFFVEHGRKYGTVDWVVKIHGMGWISADVEFCAQNIHTYHMPQNHYILMKNVKFWNYGPNATCFVTTFVKMNRPRK